jgi:hypothetical protein
VRLGVWVIGLTLLLGGYTALLLTAWTGPGPTAIGVDQPAALLAVPTATAGPGEPNGPAALAVEKPQPPRSDQESTAPLENPDRRPAPLPDGVAGGWLQPVAGSPQLRVAPPGAVRVGESGAAEALPPPVRLVILLGAVTLAGSLFVLGRR